MADLGDLILHLKADTTELDRALRDLEAKAKRVATQVDRGFQIDIDFDPRKVEAAVKAASRQRVVVDDATIRFKKFEIGNGLDRELDKFADRFGKSVARSIGREVGKTKLTPGSIGSLPMRLGGASLQGATRAVGNTLQSILSGLITGAVTGLSQRYAGGLLKTAETLAGGPRSLPVRFAKATFVDRVAENDKRVQRRATIESAYLEVQLEQLKREIRRDRREAERYRSESNPFSSAGAGFTPVSRRTPGAVRRYPVTPRNANTVDAEARVINLPPEPTAAQIRRQEIQQMKERVARLRTANDSINAHAQVLQRLIKEESAKSARSSTNLEKSLSQPTAAGKFSGLRALKDMINDGRIDPSTLDPSILSQIQKLRRPPAQASKNVTSLNPNLTDQIANVRKGFGDILLSAGGNNESRHFMTTEDTPSLEYITLAERIARRAGIRNLDWNKIPNIIADDEIPKGASGAYRPSDNTIRVNRDFFNRIQSGQGSMKDIETLIHELRHAAQFGFGTKNPFQEGVTGVGVNRLFTPNNRERKRLQRNIDFSASHGDPSERDVRRALEEDAYTFADRNQRRFFRQYKPQNRLDQGLNFLDEMGYLLTRDFDRIRETLKDGIPLDWQFKLASFKDKLVDIRGVLPNLGAGFATLQAQLQGLGIAFQRNPVGRFFANMTEGARDRIQEFGQGMGRIKQSTMEAIGALRNFGTEATRLTTQAFGIGYSAADMAAGLPQMLRNFSEKEFRKESRSLIGPAQNTLQEYQNVIDNPLSNLDAKKKGKLQEVVNEGSGIIGELQVLLSDPNLNDEKIGKIRELNGALADFYTNKLGKTPPALDDSNLIMAEMALTGSRLLPILGNLAKGFLAFQGLNLIIGLFQRFSGEIFRVSDRIGQFTQLISFSSGSASQGAKNLETIRKQIDSFNTPLAAAYHGFARLQAAAQGTQLEKQTGRISEVINQSSLVFGLDEEQTQRVYLAFEQMISKGKITSEELRLQLGESIPGAVQIMARSLGVGVAELDRMMEAGTLLSETNLMPFIEQLGSETAGGVAGAAATGRAAVNRLNNQIIELQSSIGQVLLPTRLKVLGAMAAGFQFLANNAELLVASTLSLTIALSVGLMQALASLVGFLTGQVITAFELTTAAIGFTTRALIGLARIAGVVMLAMAFADHIRSQYQSSAKDMEDFAQRAEAALNKYKKAKEGAEGPVKIGGEDKGSAASKLELDMDLKDRLNPFNLGKQIATQFSKALSEGIKRTTGKDVLFGPIAKQVRDNIKEVDKLTKSAKEAVGEVDSLFKAGSADNKMIQDLDAIDAKLTTLREQRGMTDPNDKKGLDAIQEEEDKLLEDRQKIANRINELRTAINTDIEEVAGALSLLEEKREKGYIDSSTYERLKTELEALDKSLKTRQTQLNDYFNKNLDDVNRLADALRRINEEAEKANSSLKRVATATRTQVSLAEASGVVTPGTAGRQRQNVEIAEMSGQLQILQNKLAQSLTELNDPRSISTMKQRLGIASPTDVSQAEINRILEEEKAGVRKLDKQDKDLLALLSETRKTETEIDSIQENIASRQAEVARANYDFSKELETFYRQIKRGNEDLALQMKSTMQQFADEIANLQLETKSLTLQTQIQTLKNRLRTITDSITKKFFGYGTDLSDQLDSAFNNFFDNLFKPEELKNQLDAQLQGLTSRKAQAQNQRDQQILQNVRNIEDLVIGAENTARNAPVGGSAALAPATGSTYMRMAPTGESDANGLKKMQIELIDAQGRVLDRIDARSGAPGAQALRTAAQSKSGSYEPIPEGSYRLGKPEWAAGEGNVNASFGAGLGGFWLGVESLTNTDRSALGFHLDANMASSPGSAGCIVLGDKASIMKLQKWVKESNPESLIVDYGLGTVLRNPSNPNGARAGSGNSITALRRAIIGNESGGDFGAVNPQSGALGYGQVMPENVGPWTKAALGRSLSTSEFLNSPDLQIKTIDHKLQEYFQQEMKVTGGNSDLAIRRVASSWYSGDPSLYDDPKPQYYGGVEYPSIREYTTDILKRVQEEGGMGSMGNPTVDLYKQFMQVGYGASKSKDYNTALINFQRALGMKPGDAKAQEAISNMASALGKNSPEFMTPESLRKALGGAIGSAQAQSDTYNAAITDAVAQLGGALDAKGNALKSNTAAQAEAAGQAAVGDFDKAMSGLNGTLRDLSLQTEQTNNQLTDLGLQGLEGLPSIAGDIASRGLNASTAQQLEQLKQDRIRVESLRENAIAKRNELSGMLPSMQGDRAKATQNAITRLDAVIAKSDSQLTEYDKLSDKLGETLKKQQQFQQFQKEQAQRDFEKAAIQLRQGSIAQELESLNAKAALNGIFGFTSDNLENLRVGLELEQRHLEFSVKQLEIEKQLAEQKRLLENTTDPNEQAILGENIQNLEQALSLLPKVRDEMDKTAAAQARLNAAQRKHSRESSLAGLAGNLIQQRRETLDAASQSFRLFGDQNNEGLVQAQKRMELDALRLQQLQQEMELRKQINDLEAQKTAAIGSGDLEAAKNYFQQIEVLSATLNEMPTKFGVLRQNIEDNAKGVYLFGERIASLKEVVGVMQEGFSTLFMDLFKGTKSVGDAFRDLALKIIDYFMQILINKAIIGILGMLFPGGGGAAGSILGGGGGIFGFANGGVVPGGFKAFANGGVVSKPTLGLVGEGRMNEGIVPLPDGRSIPVKLYGGGGSGAASSTVNVVVNNNGSSTTESEGKALGSAIQRAVQTEILKQQAPGGILYKGRR